MPQLTLEYTKNIDDGTLDVGEILGELHRVLAAHGGIDIASFKSRAHRLDTFRIGDGSPRNAFVHLEVALLDGRSLELRQALGQCCLDVLKSRFSKAFTTWKMQITVEMRDMEREAYLKVTSG